MYRGSNVRQKKILLMLDGALNHAVQVNRIEQAPIVGELESTCVYLSSTTKRENDCQVG